MSYTTNSTANRLKITKGWKNPSFPEILPLYSRDNIFFFKLYLFLKAYFTLKRTKLIYCDLRTSENYTKILYLVINSLPKKRKRKNTFPLWFVRPLPSGFKYSKFRDAQFRNAVHLIYLDLPELKKQVSAKLLPLSKQKVNAAFYKKPRFKTWINFLAKIKNVRTKNSLNYKRNLLRFVPTLNSKLNVQQSLYYKAKRLKNEITTLNNLFRNLQQKKALTKQNITFYKLQLLQLQKKFLKLQSSIAICKQNSVVIPKTKRLKLKNKKHFKLILNKRASKKTQKLRKRYEKLIKFNKNGKRKFRVKYLYKSKPKNWKAKIKKALLKIKKKKFKKSKLKIK